MGQAQTFEARREQRKGWLKSVVVYEYVSHADHLCCLQHWGFSKLGPVFHDDRDESISPRRKEQIEEEVTK